MKRIGTIIKENLKEQKGMITVEVSALVPLMMIIIAGVIYFFLFILDMSVAKSEAMRIADETAAAWKTEGTLETGEYKVKNLLSRDTYFLLDNKRPSLLKRAEKRLADRMKERLTVAKLYKNTVSVKLQNIKAEVQLVFRWKLRWLEEIMGEPLVFTCTVTAPADNWQEWLRKEGGLDWK